MTISFENDNDVIVYALEKVISYARRTQQIFVAQCIWKREYSAPSEECSDILHPDRIQQILLERAVSSTPRDLAEDQRLDQVLKEAEECLATSKDIRSTWQRNRINPLPRTKKQLKKDRKVKRLQEENRKTEIEKNKRLQEIRATVIRDLSRD